MKSIYTIPKVVKYDDLSKPWFVYFRYNKVLFRYKYGINYINNYKKREVEANLLRDALYGSKQKPVGRQKLSINIS